MYCYMFYMHCLVILGHIWVMLVYWLCMFSCAMLYVEYVLVSHVGLHVAFSHVRFVLMVVCVVKLDLLCIWYGHACMIGIQLE